MGTRYTSSSSPPCGSPFAANKVSDEGIPPFLGTTGVRCSNPFLSHSPRQSPVVRAALPQGTYHGAAALINQWFSFVAKWNRRWEHKQSLAREWPLAFHRWDFVWRVDPPSKHPVVSYTKRISNHTRYLRTFDQLLYAAETQLTSHEFTNVLVQLKGRHAHQPSYAQELWTLRNTLLDGFNQCVADVVPVRLRGGWFAGISSNRHKWIDLTSRRTSQKQLDNLGLVLGFSPVGLVDL